jgi:hypothetical protein
MRILNLRRLSILGLLGSGVVVFAVITLTRTTQFPAHWRGVKPGLTEAEVTRVLGAPTLTEATSITGVGGRPVTRWNYKRGRSEYYVDFDYTGPGGAPLVFRTGCSRPSWHWPRWWPWAPAATKAERGPAQAFGARSSRPQPFAHTVRERTPFSAA